MFAIININPILLYAFQVAACSAIFYLFYRSVIEPGRHFVLCRLFLLFSLTASILFPLLSIPLFSAPLFPFPEPVAHITTPITDYFLETTPQAETGLLARISPFVAGILLYLAVSSVRFVVLGLRLLSILKISRSGMFIQENGYSMIYSPKVEAPFSFLRTIYLPNTIESKDKYLYILHERAHIRSKHSIDILLCEVVSILFWFNPMFKLMGKELKKIHEYQADQEVVSCLTSVHLYQKLIAKEFLGITPKIAHAFYQSITKKRIMMLSQPLKTNQIIVRMALIVPLIALNFLLFSCSAKDVERRVVKSELESALTNVNAEIIDFTLVDSKPSFQGGTENAFTKWISERIEYPETARNKGIQGRVILSFVVDTDGLVRDVSILRGVDPDLDKEAIRVISSSPNWTPGKHRGQLVSVRYDFPVVFALVSDSHAQISLAQTQSEAVADQSGVFRLETVAKKPLFQGGDENTFTKWVSERIEYPETAKNKGIQGRVVLSFMVDTGGAIRDISVLRGVDPDLDREAIRVISSSPNWTPGKNKDGEAVNVRIQFPVVFQLR